MAIFPSSPKKGSPLISTWFTGLPFTVIFLSASISTPGSCFNNSSTLESGRTLNEDAVNSKVSFFIRIGGSA